MDNRSKNNDPRCGYKNQPRQYSQDLSPPSSTQGYLCQPSQLSFSDGTQNNARRPSLPNTPSMEKIVHFDAQLEQIKFFKKDHNPSSISRESSPEDTGITRRTLSGTTSHINPVASSLETNDHFQGDPSHPISTTSLQSHARSLTYNQQYSLPSTTAPLAPFTNNSTVGSVHVHGSHSQVYHDQVSHQSAAVPFHPQQQPPLHVPFPPSFTSGNMEVTASLQSQARGFTYNRQYGLPSTTAPLAPFTNNSTIESVYMHGSHSQGYHDPVSHQSATEPFPPQQHPPLHVPFPPSFTPGNMATPTTHSNGAAGTPIYGPPLLNPKPVYALQTHTTLALVSAPTNSFSSSITTPPSSTVPFSVGALIPASGDGGGPLLKERETDQYPPLQERETDENPPLLPPAADRSPLQKLLERLREQGGDEDAIARVPVVFKKGVSKNALKLRRRKTGGERSINFDQGYMNFVGRRQVKKENEMGGYYEDEWWCRLCPREDRKSYVAFKNLQPHLCSKHFGLPSRGKTSGRT